MTLNQNREAKDPVPVVPNLRYDTATTIAFGENVLAMWRALRGPDGRGMDRGEALKVVLEFVRGVAIGAASKKEE